MDYKTLEGFAEITKAHGLNASQAFELLTKSAGRFANLGKTLKKVAPYAAGASVVGGAGVYGYGKLKDYTTQQLDTLDGFTNGFNPVTPTPPANNNEFSTYTRQTNWNGEPNYGANVPATAAAPGTAYTATPAAGTGYNPSVDYTALQRAKTQSAGLSAWKNKVEIDRQNKLKELQSAEEDINNVSPTEYLAGQFVDTPILGGLARPFVFSGANKATSARARLKQLEAELASTTQSLETAKAEEDKLTATP